MPPHRPGYAGAAAALVAAALLTLNACGGGDDHPSARPSTAAPEPELSGKFVAEYEPAGTDRTKVEETALRDESVLEDFVDDLNANIRIPRDVRVVAKNCEESNAFYFPDDHQITLCYELGAEERDNFADAGDSGEALDTAVYQSTVATLYHEAGHALIGELDLKVTGREEDVADQAAAYILSYRDDSPEFLLTTAESYWLAAEKRPGADDSDFADIHSLDEQRATNFLCYAYGSDVDAYSDLVKDGSLDADRAEGCADEYQLMADAWQQQLEPYLEQ